MLIDVQCFYQNINYLYRIFSPNQFIHAIHGDLVSVDSFNEVQFVLFIFDESKYSDYGAEEKNYQEFIEVVSESGVMRNQFRNFDRLEF